MIESSQHSLDFQLAAQGYMVQLSIVVFFGLFAAVEIYESVKNVQLPMPIYLVLGILLAVASNAHSRSQSTSHTPTTLTLQDPE